METQSPAIERSAAPEIAVPTAPKAEEPARTGRWLPVAVKPAPMTNKPRLMQSFQAIALIRPAPQLPSFDVLPLRPKMGFSGAPRQNGGPARNGTTGQPDSGFAGSAPEPSEELPVPSFAMQNAATGRSAARKLARWLNISHRSTDE
jgi:hypothetical protein